MTGADDVLDQAARQLAAEGFAPSARFPLSASLTLTKHCSSRYPWAQTGWIFAAAGGDFWSRVTQSRTPDPDGDDQPLDDATRKRFARLCEELNTSGIRAVAIPVDAADAPSFVDVAVESGLGARSRLGLLIRRDTGTWLSLRAIILLEVETESPPQPAEDLCLDCPAPCAVACVGDAFVGVGGAWDWTQCSETRLKDQRCADTCAARLACPYGDAYRYPPERMTYHYRRSLGMLRRYGTNEL